MEPSGQGSSRERGEQLGQPLECLPNHDAPERDTQGRRGVTATCARTGVRGTKAASG